MSRVYEFVATVDNRSIFIQAKEVKVEYLTP